MKFYGISGLGADERVFKYLTIENELIPLKWIEPRENERIEAYARRMAEKINLKEPYGIIGVSFGGLVAVEMSKVMNPEITVLVSSAETRNELRGIYRMLGKSNLMRLIPYQMFDPPRKIASWLFGAKKKSLLNEILNDTDLRFAKWAVNELINWRNTEKLTTPLLKIGGESDKLIPPKGDSILIKNGGHFMIVDKADEISEVIKESIKTTYNVKG